VCVGGGGQKCIHGFGGETWGKEALGRLRPGGKNNFKMDLKEMEGGEVD